MKKSPTRNYYGWVADLPDARDHSYAAPLAVVQTLPPKVDLSGDCPSVYDQGRIGSCTGNAIAAAVQFTVKKEKHTDLTPSRLFIYWNERNTEHSVPLDGGAQIRDGIKVVNKLGVCAESSWPYDDTPADPKTNMWETGAKPVLKPTAACFAEAKKHLAISYQRVNRTLNDMRGCLASGYPFVMGFTCYDSFESPAVAKSGMLNMPAPKEGVVGGHAVLAVGYDDSTQRFTIRNSWGPGWGRKGYFTMPYTYLLDPNLSDDFWTIRFVE